MGDIKTGEWVTPTGIEMVIKTSRIPDEVLEEIFPKKLKRYGASEKVYSQLKEMILSVSRDVAHGVISQLKKGGKFILRKDCSGVQCQ